MDPQFVWAVASIYYQAHRVGDGAWVTEEIHDIVLDTAARLGTFAPLDIEDALDVITPVVDSGGGTPTERWSAGRAIVKLFGANLLDPADDKISALFEALHLPEMVVVGALDTRVEREIQAEQFLMEDGLLGTCGSTLPVDDPIVLDPLTATLTLNAKVHAQKPLSAVAKALDPQSWPICSEFFDTVFVIQHQDFVFPKNLRPPLAGVAQPIGGTWSKPDLVYEKFVIPGAVSIENVLGIETRLDPLQKRYDLTYWLEYPWYSNFYGSEAMGGLSADGGFAYAEHSGPTDTIVTSQKVLGFQDRESPYHVPGVYLMYSTAFLMQYAMDQAFLQAICCEHEDTDETGPVVVPPHNEQERERSSQPMTDDSEDHSEFCSRYVDTWLGFWRECTNKYLQNAPTHRVRVGDKGSRQVVARLTDDAFDWWSDAAHLWVDASHGCLPKHSSAANAKAVAALALFAPNDRNLVTATFATRETETPWVLLVGYDGKNHSKHVFVRLIDNGRAEVVFKPTANGKNGPKAIADGVYHGVVLKAHSFEILASVSVVKSAFKKPPDSAAPQYGRRVDDVR